MSEANRGRCGVELTWVLAAAVCAGTAAGCGGGGTDGEVCEGDRWVADDSMLAGVADCGVVDGNLTLTGNLLTAVALPSLAQVTGNFSIWGNPALTRVHLPKLASTGGWLHIDANEALTELTLPGLAAVNTRAATSIADLSISGNPRLPSCRAEAIRDRLLARSFRGSVRVEGNLADCPR